MTSVVEQVAAAVPETLLTRLRAHVSGLGAPLEVTSPLTGGVIATLPTDTVDDVKAAFMRARAAQRAWLATSLDDRIAIMLRFHDLLLAKRVEGDDIVQAETGKARRDAAEELLDIAMTARHYARDAHRLLRPKSVRAGLPLIVGSTIYRQPKGVVGVIAPWNYPLTLAITDAIPALLAGNAVVLKPDVQTPLSALWVRDLLDRAGLPRDVMQIVLGNGTTLGPTIIENSDFVMFTGSTRVGREIAARCGERLIGCSLELGGKNAMIIRADADIQRAAAIARRASFANAGQLCISMERIYVDESIFEPFVEAFAAATRALTIVPGIGWAGQFGSLISPAHADRVQAHVDEAVAKGATLVTGGKRRPDLGPAFFEPTILTGVDESMSMCASETFGPVVAVYPTSSDSEAIARSNDTEYGLNGAIVTQDLAAGERIATRLRVGTANINEGYAAAWSTLRAPMGGMGASGLGRRHGDEGLLKYTEPQTTSSMRKFGFDPQFGMTDEQWANTLAQALGIMKRIGLK